MGCFFCFFIICRAIVLLRAYCELRRNRCCGWLEHPRSPGAGVRRGVVGGLLHRQTPNRQTCRHPHACTHICTQGCLAWKPIEAGPNINYLFFSRGLVTVIRVRGFLESGAHAGLMRKTGLSIELSRHTWSALWLGKCICVCVCVCVCVCTSVWVWLLLLQAHCWERHTPNPRVLEADVRVETLPKQETRSFT